MISVTEAETIRATLYFAGFERWSDWDSYDDIAEKDE